MKYDLHVIHFHEKAKTLTRKHFDNRCAVMKTDGLSVSVDFVKFAQVHLYVQYEPHVITLHISNLYPFFYVTFRRYMSKVRHVRR